MTRRRLREVQHLEMRKDESYLDFACRVAMLPNHIWLPSVDIKSELESFARDNGYLVMDVSSLFHRHNASFPYVIQTINILERRCKDNPTTMHFFLTSEYNLEAVAKYVSAYHTIGNLLSKVLKDTSYSPGGEDVVGYRMLHAVVMLNDFKLDMYDVKSLTQVRTLLQSFEALGECPVCMQEFATTETKFAFECRHPLCSGCADIEYECCPICRSTKAWNNGLFALK
jgi:hypothetical protein